MRKAILKAVVLLLLTFVVSVGFFLLVTKISWINKIDAMVYELISRTWKHPLLTSLFSPFGLWFFPKPWRSIFFQPAFFYFLLFPTAFYLLVKQRKDFLWWLLGTTIATFLSGLVLSLHWHHFFRERPFTVLPSNVSEGVKASLKKWPSFPSGHTRDTAAYSGVVMGFIPGSRYLIWFLILLVGYARVYSGEHYPTDVLGGIVVGLLVGQSALAILDLLKVLLKGFRKRYGKSNKS